MFKATDSQTPGVHERPVEIGNESDDNKPSEVRNYVISLENDGNPEIVSGTTALDQGDINSVCLPPSIILYFID